MSRKATIRGGAAFIDECAASIQAKYEANHHDVEKALLERPNSVGMLVKIKSNARFWQSGWKSRVSLSLTLTGDDLEINVGGGIWWGTIVIAALCLCCGYWAPIPLAVVIMREISSQKKLRDQVFNDTVQWFDSRKAWLDGGTVRLRTSH